MLLYPFIPTIPLDPEAVWLQDSVGIELSFYLHGLIALPSNQTLRNQLNLSVICKQTCEAFLIRFLEL